MAKRLIAWERTFVIIFGNIFAVRAIYCAQSNASKLVAGYICNFRMASNVNVNINAICSQPSTIYRTTRAGAGKAWLPSLSIPCVRRLLSLLKAQRFESAKPF